MRNIIFLSLCDILLYEGGVHMKRKIEQQLLKWKQMPNKKPLLIKGARQVGKTLQVVSYSSLYRY